MLQSIVQIRPFVWRQGHGAILRLKRIGAQIVERYQTSGEFTIQKIVRLVDCTHTRICIVVGIHAEAERIVFPQGSSPPVCAVVTETVHSLGNTFLFQFGFATSFSLLFLLSFLLQLATSLFGNVRFDWITSKWRTNFGLTNAFSWIVQSSVLGSCGWLKIRIPKRLCSIWKLASTFTKRTICGKIIKNRPLRRRWLTKTAG